MGGAGIMKNAIYGFLAGLISILAVIAAYLNRKAESATEALNDKKNQLANEVRHNEATQRRKEVDEHVNGLDDKHIRDQLRKHP